MAERDRPRAWTIRLSLQDALPISVFDQISEIKVMHAVDAKQQDMPHRMLSWSRSVVVRVLRICSEWTQERHCAHQSNPQRSEEHTSELQSPYELACRLRREKKKPT